MSAMVDVSVVCSCTRKRAVHCGQFPSAYLQICVKAKRRTYRVLATQLQRKLYPAVFDALGVPSIEAADMVQDMVDVAVASGMLAESARTGFVLNALTKLVFAVSLHNLTGLVRPSLGLNPTTGIPLPALAAGLGLLSLRRPLPTRWLRLTCARAAVRPLLGDAVRLMVTMSTTMTLMWTLCCVICW